MPKDAQDEEAKVESPLYDLVGAELFLPFSIHFAGGQRFEINTREYIGFDPVSRTASGTNCDTGEALTWR